MGIPPAMGRCEESVMVLDGFRTHPQWLGSAPHPGSPPPLCSPTPTYEGAAPERDAQVPPLHVPRWFGTRASLGSGLAENTVEVRAADGALALGHAAAVRLDDLASGVALLLALHAVEVARVRLAGLYRFCHCVNVSCFALAAVCGTGLVSP